MNTVSRHALARARQRLGLRDAETAARVVRSAVAAPVATRETNTPGIRRYGAVVEGLALVVTVDERVQPPVAMSVRPGTCGSSGAGRVRGVRADRYVWERPSWART